MEEYYLFLDESKPNSNFENFTLGGVAVNKKQYDDLVKSINKLKTDIFLNDAVILHEFDIRGKKGEFIGITQTQQENFFNGLGEIFSKDKLLKVLAVSINTNDLEKLYNLEEINDIYYIALQLLMENFTHFLSKNNGVGTIFLETTDIANNTKLQNLFHMLKATGTLFFKKESLQKRLSTINFAIKSENNIGLQLADFVPNPLARCALGKKQKLYSIFDDIKKILYDGELGMQNRYGFKIIK